MWLDDILRKVEVAPGKRGRRDKANNTLRPKQRPALRDDKQEEKYINLHHPPTQEEQTVKMTPTLRQNDAWKSKKFLL